MTIDKEWVVRESDLGCDGAYLSNCEIVRCSECKFASTNKSVMTENPLMRCAIFRTMTEPNGFCYKGERREGETYETKPGVQIKI